MKTLSRHLSVAALFAWGALMLYFYFSGRLTNYVAPFLKPLVVLSGVFLLVIGVCILFGGKQLSGVLSTEDTARELYAPARVRVTKWLAFLLLVGPVWVAAGVSKDRYGDAAILNKGINTTLSPGYAGRSVAVPPPPAANAPAQPAAIEPPLPGATPLPPDSNSALDAAQYLKKTADGNIIAEVTDLLFAAEDASMRPLFEGRTVEMIGQYLPVKDASDKRFQIVRMFMVCCAADARPIALAVLPPPANATTASNKAPIEMAWTRITGTVEFPLENGRRIPIVHAQKVTPCDPPSEAMLY